MGLTVVVKSIYRRLPGFVQETAKEIVPDTVRFAVVKGDRPSAADTEQLWLEAEDAASRGEWLSAIHLWRTLLAPEHSAPRATVTARLAKAYRKTGDLRAARELLTNLPVELQTLPSTSLQLAELDIADGAWESARSRLEGLVRQNDFQDTSRHYTLLGRSLVGLEHYSAAREVYETGLGQFPEALDLLQGYAELADRQKLWSMSAERWRACAEVAERLGEEEFHARAKHRQGRALRRMEHSELDQAQVLSALIAEAQNIGRTLSKRFQGRGLSGLTPALEARQHRRTLRRRRHRLGVADRHRAARMLAAQGRHAESLVQLGHVISIVGPTPELLWQTSKQAFLASDRLAFTEFTNRALEKDPVVAGYQWLSDEFLDVAGDERLLLVTHRPSVSWELAHTLVEKDTATSAVILDTSPERWRRSHPSTSKRIAAISKFPWERGIRSLSRLRTLDELCEGVGSTNIGYILSNDRLLAAITRQGVFYERGHAYTSAQLEMTAQVVYSAVDELLLAFRPTFAVLPDVGHTHEFMLNEALKRRKVTVAHVLPTRVANYISVSNSRHEQFPFAQDASANPSAKAMGLALDYVKQHESFEREFHDSAQLSGRGLVDQRADEAEGLGILLSDLRRLRKHLRLEWRDRDLDGEPRILQYRGGRPAQQSRALHRRRRQSRNLDKVPFSRPSSRDTYFLYALHSEPEIALTLYGPHMPSQEAVVEVVSRAVPAGSLLYVKDHPRMPGQRDVDYYSRLLAFNPRIRLIHPGENILPFIANAQGVLTFAGTAGFEAQMLGVPAVTFGSCHYQHLPGVVPLRSFEALPESLEFVASEEFPGKEAIRNAALKYIAGTIDEGFPIGWYSDLIEGRGYDYRSKEFADFVSFLAEALTRARDDERFRYDARFGLTISQA